LVGAGQKKFGPTPEFLSVHGCPSSAAFVGSITVFALTVFAIYGSGAIDRKSLRACSGVRRLTAIHSVAATGVRMW